MKRLLICQKPQIVIPNNFKDQENIIFCNDDLSDLLDKCDYYLKHEDQREAIAKNALSHLNEYHTDVKRADYILREIDTFSSSHKKNGHA